jgi:hypothetical protein
LLLYDPSINKGDWNATEDRILFEGQKQFGNRWCEISKVLPGRTENSVKNRWNSSAMRKFLKDNDLIAGSGIPLYDINAVEDLQRALNDFAESLAKCGITISKESEATLLLDMTCPAPDEKKNALKEKVKKEKVKKNPKEEKVKKEKEAPHRGGAVSTTRGSSNSSSSASSSLSSAGPSDTSSQGIKFGSDYNMDTESSSSSQKTYKHRDGMLLPSHLRPPLIVTIANTRNQTSGTGSQGQDHELLVEMLSNLKSSPVYGGELTNERNRSHEHNGTGGKRSRGEKSGESVTPTERALSRVRSGLSIYSCIYIHIRIYIHI